MTENINSMVIKDKVDNNNITGKILDVVERNYYDDSDFDAIYFDEPTNTLRKKTVASTRYQSSIPKIDATNSVLFSSEILMLNFLYEKIMPEIIKLKATNHQIDWLKVHRHINSNKTNYNLYFS